MKYLYGRKVYKYGSTLTPFSMVDDVKDQSEYNDSLGYLRRINACLTMAQDASMNSNVRAWLAALSALSRELSTEMNDAAKRYVEDKIIELNNDIIKAESGRFSGKIPAELVMKLHKWDVELRAINDKAGLQIKRKEDRRFGL